MSKKDFEKAVSSRIGGVRVELDVRHCLDAEEMGGTDGMGGKRRKIEGGRLAGRMTGYGWHVASAEKG